MAVDKILFNSIDYERINSFTLDPHRQEELRDSQNRLWVNDTKATNIDASVAAIKRYMNEYIHLILGGDDKGVDLTQLFEFLKGIEVKVYNIGSNKEKLCTFSQEYNIEYELCSDLSNAVAKIAQNLEKKEVALLSPAASSLDEFSSYAERGDLFKKEASKL